MCLMDTTTKFNKVEERDRISTQESCTLEWFNRQFHIRGRQGFGHGTGGGRTRKNDKECLFRFVRVDIHHFLTSCSWCVKSFFSLVRFSYSPLKKKNESTVRVFCFAYSCGSTFISFCLYRLPKRHMMCTGVFIMNRENESYR